MYSSIRNVQILIAMLKEYNVKNIVISPGGNNIPIIHSIETDLYFKCYSVVDERSAAYFAMGLAQQLDSTVALVCTSGTAVCNYLPGLTEALYQRVPLIAISSDKNIYMSGQLETQKIEQTGFLSSVCKKEVTLPVVVDDNDAWYCSRILNEAFIAAERNGRGPVHINVPTKGSPSDFSCASLPNVTRINIASCGEGDELVWSKCAKLISETEKLLIVCGEDYRRQDSSYDLMFQFAERIGAVVVGDYVANCHSDKMMLSYRICETMLNESFEAIAPQLVITIGNNILSNRFKLFMRNRRKSIIHIAVDEAGEIRDVFKCLSTVFQCTNSEFFSKMLSLCPDNITKRKYSECWCNARKKTLVYENDFSELYAIKQLSDSIPENSVVHTGILNSTRGYHLYEHNKALQAYSNIGALGIDGSLSSFIGQSFATENLCFLIIGDLSFFYDMNSIGITGIRENVRIMLLNNGGGAEFHFNMGRDRIPTINDNISVAHGKKAQGWVESLGFSYYSAKNTEELAQGIKHLTGKSDKPVLLEVISDMEKDAGIVNNMIKDIVIGRDVKLQIKGKVRDILHIK